MEAQTQEQPKPAEEQKHDTRTGLSPEREAELKKIGEAENAKTPWYKGFTGGVLAGSVVTAAILTGGYFFVQWYANRED